MPPKNHPFRVVFQTYKALNSYEVARIELSRSSCFELFVLYIEVVEFRKLFSSFFSII